MKKIVSVCTVLTICFVFVLTQPIYASDCNVDSVNGKTYGCDDSCGERVGNGFVIFQAYPTVSRCKTKWHNDHWTGAYTQFCPGWEGRCNAGMLPDPDTTARCWRCKCPEGTYFQGDINGKVDYNCAPCTGLKKTIQGGVCWDLVCPEKTNGSPTYGMSFGKDAVIWNGKCLPVCDLQTAGAVYSSDSTYISVKIKTKNAAKIGEASQ